MLMVFTATVSSTRFARNLRTFDVSREVADRRRRVPAACKFIRMRWIKADARIKGSTCASDCYKHGTDQIIELSGVDENPDR
jgi:hypothetical protein